MTGLAAANLSFFDNLPRCKPTVVAAIKLPRPSLKLLLFFKKKNSSVLQRMMKPTLVSIVT